MASDPQLSDMLLAVCLLLCSDSTSYSGRDRQPDVRIPRLEAEVVIDGDLSDSVWAHAARLTLASRDQIFGDDNVQILLGTFHDAKQVLMFAVNPLGVQGDGSLVEGADVALLARDLDHVDKAPPR